MWFENDIYVQMEVVDENEWWGKIEQMKGGGEEEMIIKHSFNQAGQQTLYDMACALIQFSHHICTSILQKTI